VYKYSGKPSIAKWKAERPRKYWNSTILHYAKILGIGKRAAGFMG